MTYQETRRNNKSNSEIVGKEKQMESSQKEVENQTENNKENQDNGNEQVE